MNEFELISHYFSFSAGALAAPDLGVGDDCALLTVPEDHQLAVSTDTLVSGIHFPADGAPDRIAQRALRVNLSDLAAMGAAPLGFQLALSLPDVNEGWLARFSAGLAEDAIAFGCPLIGGDTTKGPMAITITVMGALMKGQAVRRAGARSGDAIYVTGTLGDSAAGLACLNGEASSDFLLDRYWLPSPRLAFAQALARFSNAAVDISDGLLQDLNHIVKASSQRLGATLSANIELDLLPLSAEALRCFGEQKTREYALVGGDDYELCFTVSPERESALLAAIQGTGIPVSKIGTMVENGPPAVRVVNMDGDILTLEQHGYDHFRTGR